MNDLPTGLTTALADRYRLDRELGQGGMATVYLAEDLRHRRSVAIKVLRPELAAVIGAERFVNEIRTIAALQHPHILGLIDSGEVQGTAYYVMPFVEGESLRDRLVREKQLPVAGALRIATEVAGALDYAHRHGVIHRDIKPENILLHDGSALVADFGIALAVSSAGGTRMTETGMSLGTPHYMSPEQAMGEREVTPRSDIYALGCVLYEMLLGEPPFTGPTAQAIVARVMTERPRSLTAQRHTVPDNVEMVVHRALEKLPADRFASAAEFLEALKNPGLTRAAVAPRGARPAWRRILELGRTALPWVVTVVAVAVGIAGYRRGSAGSPSILRRYLIAASDSTAFDLGANGGTISWASDGSALAYTSRQGIVVRYADRLEFAPLPNTRGGSDPFFSPDGRWLGFRGNGDRLSKVALAGGTPVLLCDSCPGFQFEWGRDGVIRYHAAPRDLTSGRVLMQLDARGGKPAVLARSDSARIELFRGPTLLPDRRTVLFTAWLRDTPRLSALDIRSGKVTRFDQTGVLVGYVEAGYLVLGNLDGSLIALPFDASALRISGPPVTIARDLMVNDAVTVRAGVSPIGDIAYLQSRGYGERQMVLVTRAGRVTEIPGPRRSFAGPALSPDGRRIVVGIRDENGADLWARDLGQGGWTRLTTNRISDRPVWMPDGKRIVYSSNADLWRLSADGSTPPESVLVAVGSRYANSVTADGRTLAFYEPGLGLRALAFDSGPRARIVVPAGFNEAVPSVSPDGRWLAYQSEESGRTEIYVRPLDGGGARVRVSLEGGMEPFWSRDGREIFYRAADTMMTAAIRVAPEFQVTGRRTLFTGAYYRGAGFREYDVSADGQRFLMLRGENSNPGLVVVHGFFDHLPASGTR